MRNVKKQIPRPTRVTKPKNRPIRSKPKHRPKPVRTAHKQRNVKLGMQTAHAQQPKVQRIHQVQHTTRNVTNPNIVGEFGQGVRNQAVDYQSIVNPDYQHKSVLNQAIDRSFQGDFGGAGKLIQDNPVRFAGNIAMEAGAMLVPVGAALKVARGTSIAVKQSHKIGQTQEAIRSAVLRKEKRGPVYQAVGGEGDKMFHTPWFEVGHPGLDWVSKAATSSASHAVSGTPAKIWVRKAMVSKSDTEFYQVSLIREDSIKQRGIKQHGTSEKYPMNKFYTRKEIEDLVKRDKDLGDKHSTYALARWIETDGKAPMGDVLIQTSRDKQPYILLPRNVETKTVALDKSNFKQTMANILAKEPFESPKYPNKGLATREEMKGIVANRMRHEMVMNETLSGTYMPPGGTGQKVQFKYTQSPSSRAGLGFEGVADKMYQPTLSYASFAPLAVVPPILSLTQKTQIGVFHGNNKKNPRIDDKRKSPI